MVSYIIAGIFGVIGIASLVGFFLKLRVFLKVRAYGGRTRAEVVGVKAEEISAGKNQTETYYSPIIQYRAGGILYRKNFSKISSLSKQKVGSLIPIRYDLKDPSNFESENMTELFLQTFGLLVASVGIFAFIANVII